MRRTLAAVLMTALCLLTACGSKETDELQAAMDFRAALLQAEGCPFTAAVTADYGDRSYEFTLDCVCRTDGTATVTVCAPQTIAGISASVQQAGAQLEFDGMALDFGTMADGTVSPVSAPIRLCQCWAQEYISAAGMEEENLRVTYEQGYDSETLTADTWFSPENGVPIFAQICYNDQIILKMTLTDFSMNSGG